MSGELIQTERYVRAHDPFERGAGGFSKEAISDLMDVNDDGVLTGIEKDQLTSAGVLNTLESIHPVIARGFVDKSFQLNRGIMLTKSQRQENSRVIDLITKALDKHDKAQYPDQRITPEALHGIEGNPSYSDLADDIAHRRYLDQSELDNSV